MQPYQGEFLGFAEVDFVEVAVLGAVSIPVPGAMPMLTASGQGALGAVKGKRADIGLCEPRIPGLGSNCNDRQALIGTLGWDQAIIDYLGNSMACHITMYLIIKRTLAQADGANADSVS